MTPNLIARYEQRVPRYTSYPTAPHFTDAVGPETYAAWLGELAAGSTTSLYLHVPFCAELCLYCGCHTTVARRYAPIAAYVDMIEREMDRVADALTAPLSVRHIHWGGGTPTILRPSDFLQLMDGIRQRFGIENGAELAVEIDPRTITPAGIQALAAGGINRASLGVQSFDPTVQQTIRRIQSFAETLRVSEWLRFSGIQAINLDLMYGLPFQTVENLLTTVSRALELDPDRVSLFGYAHVPWMKRHQALLPEDALPQASERYAQFEAAAEEIVKAGYVRIGLDHFAKPDDPLASAAAGGRLHRNFQGYTTDEAPALIGFGTSAISRLPQGFAQNTPSTVEYRKAVLEERLPTVRGIALTDEDRLRGTVIERLMCDLKIDLDEVCRTHQVDPDHFAAEIEAIDRLAEDRLVTREGMRIEVPEPARPFIRTLCAAFDARLASTAARHAPSI
ncbi:MAG TPA: oxygen-independent coproporphyrinogen III oxidase [Microvirga sp.]|jgi:oxygen-independent coproporphyrinogen-3 oxidase